MESKQPGSNGYLRGRIELSNPTWTAATPDPVKDFFNEVLFAKREHTFSKQEVGMGLLNGLKEQLALLVLPVVIGEGWKAVPEGLKPEFAVILGTCETELRALAAKSETPIDDAAISRVYTDVKEWAAAQGHPALLEELDHFCQIGK